jgi:hypothetical protein
MMSPWYQRIFSTRLAPHRQAVQEFITTRGVRRRQPSAIATSSRVSSRWRRQNSRHTPVPARAEMVPPVIKHAVIKHAGLEPFSGRAA